MMLRDLSHHHRPLGDLFQEPSAPRDRFRLSAEDLEFFRKNGYLAGLRVLTDGQVEALREELSAILGRDPPGKELFYEFNRNESEDPQKALFHALGAWRLLEGFHDLLWNQSILAPACQLLGGPVRFWHDQIFSKPPRRGGVVAWHQDYSYWTRTRPMAHLTCWIGLDDATLENGCLQYIPGSHGWDHLPITGLAGGMKAIESVLSPEQKRCFKPVPIELKKGECSFHHPLTVHGSGENASQRPRRGAVLNFVRDGVMSDSDEALLEGVPVVPKGEPLGGRFFPLLYDPEERL